MSEKFEFEVAYSTSFEQIENLRAKMLAFVKAEKRDYQPSFDVVVVGAPPIAYHSLSSCGISPNSTQISLDKKRCFSQLTSNIRAIGSRARSKVGSRALSIRYLHNVDCPKLVNRRS